MILAHLLIGCVAGPAPGAPGNPLDDFACSGTWRATTSGPALAPSLAGPLSTDWPDPSAMALAGTTFSLEYEAPSAAWEIWESDSPDDCRLMTTWRAQSVDATLSFPDSGYEAVGTVDVAVGDLDGHLGHHVAFSGTLPGDAELEARAASLGIDTTGVEYTAGLRLVDPALRPCDEMECAYFLGTRADSELSTIERGQASE